MHRSLARTGAMVALLWVVLLVAAATLGVVLISGGSVGTVDPVLLAPAIVTGALLASVACAWGWSRGRERRREHARAMAPPLTWAHPDVTDAALSDPGRRDRMG